MAVELVDDNPIVNMEGADVSLKVSSLFLCEYHKASIKG